MLKLSGIKAHFKNADNVIDASVDVALLFLEFLATPVLIPIRIARFYIKMMITYDSIMIKYIKLDIFSIPWGTSSPPDPLALAL